MNWDDLKLFLAVSRCGTISGAAKQFNVQHSTVSRRIKMLEKSLGVSLLKRIDNRYQLTDEGVKIESAAISMEKEVLNFDGRLSGKNNSLTGSIRVSTISTLASTILMPVFDSFCQAYPQIELHIMVSNKTISLANREADVVIRMTNTPPETLVGKRVATVASTIYACTRYLNSANGAKKMKWIGAKCCDFHDSWTKQTCDDKQHQFYSDDSTTILSAVQQGMGVTFLPCFLGDTDPLLKRYCDPKPQFNLGLWILSHPELNNNARLLAFRNHLIVSMQEQQALLEGNLHKSTGTINPED